LPCRKNVCWLRGCARGTKTVLEVLTLCPVLVAEGAGFPMVARSRGGSVERCERPSAMRYLA